MRYTYIFVLAICFLVNLYGISGEEILKNVNKKFNSLNTFQADFKQLEQWDLTDEESVTEGRIYYKNKDLFRVETEGIFVLSNGKVVWRYSQANNQVLIEEIEDGEGVMLPGKLLFEFTTEYILKDFFEKTINNKKMYVIDLSSKEGEEKFINRIKAYVNEEFIVEKMEYENLDENKVTFILKNIRLNGDIPATKFEYQKIENVEVMDLRD